MSLQRARKALDEDELEVLRERARYFGLMADDSKEFGRSKSEITFSTFLKNYTKAIDNNSKYGIIKSFEIGRSVGAATKNYPVKMPDSKQHVKLAEDQKVEGTAFAGKGTKKEIRDKFRLESFYKIPADEWQKVSGVGYVMVDGKPRKAELHWYEADGEIVEMKVKRFYEES